jgi:hypothetical protein
LPDTPKTEIYALFKCYHEEKKASVFSGYFRLELSSIIDILRSSQDKVMDITRSYPLSKLSDSDKVSGDLMMTIVIKRYYYEDPDHPLQLLTTTVPSKIVSIYTSSTSTSSNLDIILIHGFTSDWNETWAVKDKTHELWPNAWLQFDLSGPRTIFVKYKKNSVTTISR